VAASQESPQISEARLSFRLPADPARLRRARERIRDYLHLHGVDERLVNDVVLSIDEACANVIRHSGSPDLEVSIALDEADLLIDVIDHGRGFDFTSFDPRATPDPLSSHGRGLFIMAKLMDDLNLRLNDGLEVHMIMRDAAHPAGKSFHSGIGAASAGRPAESERRTRSLLEDIDEAFLALDWGYRCVYANNAALRLADKSRDELLGRTLTDVWPAFADTRIAKAHRAAMELGTASIVEYRAVGSNAWLEERVYPTATGVSIYARDITPRKQMEEALARGEERYGALLTSMSEGFALHEIIRDDNGAPVDYRFLEVNPAFERLTGLGREDVVGRTAAEILPREDPEWMALCGRVALTGESVDCSGYSQTLQLHFDVRVFRPAPDQFATVFVDSTERYRAERERELLLERGREAEQQATTELKSTNILLGAAYALSAWSSLDDILDSLLVAILEQSAHTRASVILWDEERGELRTAASKGPAAVPAGTVMPLAEASPHTRRAVAEKALVLADYDALPPGERRLADQYASHLSLIVPLMYQQRLLGLIAIDDPGERRPIGEREIEMVRGLASHAAIAIEQARLFELERARLDKLQALHELTILAVSSLEPHRVAETAVAHLVAHLGVSAAMMFVLDESRRRLVLAALHGFPERLFQDDPEGLGLDEPWDVVTAFTSQEPLVRGDATGDDVSDAVRQLYARYGQPLGANLVLPVPGRSGPLGVVTLTWDKPRRIDDAELTFFTAAMRQIGIALENARLFTAEAERARLAEALEGIGHAIHSTLEAPDILQRSLVEGVLALRADAGTIELLSETWTVRHQHGLAPSDGDMLGEGGSPISALAAQGQRPVLCDDLRSNAALSAGYVDAQGLRSVLAVPMIAKENAIGCLLFFDRRPRTYSDLEIDFASKLAATVSLAVENARLIETQQEAARLSTALNEINRLIHTTPDMDAALHAVIAEAVTAVGADSGVIALRRGADWVAEYGHATTPSILQLRVSTQDAPFVRTVVDERRAVVIDDCDADPRCLPDHHRGLGPRSVLCVPLVPRDEVIGVVILNHHRATVHFDAQTIDFAGKLAAAVSAALENARLFRAQQRIATTLQENFIHPLPVVPGLTLAAVSATAAVPELVGGDFHDVFELPDGRVVLLIGDVMGKGVRAAGLTATLRTAVRAVALTTSSPRQILPTVNQLLMREQSEQLATLLLLALNVTTGHALVGSAGHPPPVHLRAAEATLVACRFGAPLGAFEESSYTMSDLELIPGDALVLYTDGVTEARRSGELFNEAGLLSVMRNVSSNDPEVLVETLRAAVDSFADRLRDDLQILALRLR
jgi:PAS domain S-box-containing protein